MLWVAGVRQGDDSSMWLLTSAVTVADELFVAKHQGVDLREAAYEGPINMGSESLDRYSEDESSSGTRSAHLDRFTDFVTSINFSESSDRPVYSIRV